MKDMMTRNMSMAQDVENIGKMPINPDTIEDTIGSNESDEVVGAKKNKKRKKP